VKKENKNINADEFKRKKLILKSYPRKIYLELTRNCNNSCIMCHRERFSNIVKYDSKFDMSFNLFKRIADRIFPYAEFVDLRGWGESTIMKNFMEYVNYALKFNCKFGLNTNLTVQNDEIWENLVKNNFIFDISFDGATKATFEFIRRGAIFENVVNNVKKLVDFTNEYNKPIDNFNFLVTVQNYNIKEIPKIVTLADKLGIKRIRLSPVSLGENDPNHLSNCPEKVGKYIPIAIKLAKEKNIKIRLTGSFGLEKIEKKGRFKVQKKCEIPWSSIYIDYKGFVGPCNHLMPRIFQNLNLKNNHFKNVWNNFDFLLFRSMINTKYRGYLSDFCESCFKYRFVCQYLSDDI
jgi:radical SAM protein with 4Fe4S-binding SPASM domain